jgi:hypothetical protein
VEAGTVLIESRQHREDRFMDIRAGTPAVASDGRQYGIVQAVVINRSVNEIVGIVIRREAAAATSVVPIDMVEDATPEAVSLRGSAADLEKLPSKVEEYYGEVPAGWMPAPGFGAGEVTDREDPSNPQSIAKTDVRVGGHAEVICLDGIVGTVDRLLVDDYTGEVSAVVVAPGRYLDHPVEVPFSWVQSMDDGRLHLSCNRSQLKTFPTASPDVY